MTNDIDCLQALYELSYSYKPRQARKASGASKIRRFLSDALVLQPPPTRGGEAREG